MVMKITNHTEFLATGTYSEFQKVVANYNSSNIYRIHFLIVETKSSQKISEYIEGIKNFTNTKVYILFEKGQPDAAGFKICLDGKTFMITSGHAAKRDVGTFVGKDLVCGLKIPHTHTQYDIAVYAVPYDNDCFSYTEMTEKPFSGKAVMFDFQNKDVVVSDASISTKIEVFRGGEIYRKANFVYPASGNSGSPVIDNLERAAGVVKGYVYNFPFGDKQGAIVPFTTVVTDILKDSVRRFPKKLPVTCSVGDINSDVEAAVNAITQLFSRVGL
jgi:hypothetical protein